MLVRYPDLARYQRPTTQHVNWLIRSGVPLRALTRTPMVLVAHGYKAHDGVFEEHCGGEEWLAFAHHDDVVYWQPRSCQVARWNNRCFALGQDAIHAASTYAFDGYLAVFESPLDYLRANRSGIVIVAWDRAFDELRDCPRLAVAESLSDKLKHHLQPPHMPEILVLRQREAAA